MIKIQDILNEYQQDYAVAMGELKGYPYGSLKNKEILVLGYKDNPLMEAIVYSFLSLNDSRNLNIKVKLLELRAAVEGKEDSSLYSLLKDREDISFYTFDSYTEDSVAYIIDTGICSLSLKEEKISNAMVLENANKALKLAGKLKPENYILLSDYRAYGEVSEGFYISEHEFGAMELDSENSLEGQLLRTYEALCACHGNQYKFNWTILRCGIIIGPEISFKGRWIDELLEAFIAEKEQVYKRSTRSYSFLYISDLMTALLHTLNQYPPKVYNLVSRGCTKTIGELVEVLYQRFPGKGEILLKNHEGIVPEGCALYGELLPHYGWQGSVSMEDILILKVESLLKEKDIFIFDNSYFGKLDTVHEILLGYLLEIDRICKKHDIKYFLAGGTLLGAIRHGGFIPWDDDADVMMLREDYDKFCSIIERELPSNLFYQVPRTEELNHNVFSKIRINNTLFATVFTGKFMDMHNGIFMDVVCHDKTSNSPFFQKLHINLTRLTRSLVFNKWGNTPIKSGGRHPFLCRIATVFKNIMPMRLLEKWQEMALTFYKNRKASRYLYDGMGRNIGRGVFPKEYLDEAILVDFHGFKLPVPKEYDKYLTYLYGDYKTMIPVSKRRTSHSIVLMDLGEYVDYRIKGKTTPSITRED
ncbi:LicD family protein [Alloiococcus sp. CFN-8]|uniref:LicD family protein n=1 Tax=Alloiococcus sp. CFN-8 TaxID=3416081 RepID=UPI003CF315CA